MSNTQALIDYLRAIGISDVRCLQAADTITRLTAERDAARETVAGLAREADLLAWVLAHPETAAECLEDAAAGDGTARANLQSRRDGLESAAIRAAKGA